MLCVFSVCEHFFVVEIMLRFLASASFIVKKMNLVDTFERLNLFMKKRYSYFLYTWIT